MKTLKKIFISAVLLAGMVSCSLEETPEHFVDSGRFYETEAQCRAALNSCYDKLNGIFNYKMFLMTELQSDLWFNSGAEYDATLDITPSSPAHGETVWTSSYSAIMICNECVECIASSSLPDEVKMPMVAEARVMRALYYHILTQVFNGVPFYCDRVDSIEKMEQIRRLPRTDASLIREALYEDLKTNALPYFTEENGLKDTSYRVGNQRAGYALALYLMANFALWNNEYYAALEPLQELEAIYGQLTEERYPLSETLWSLSNTAESIFEIQHSWSVTGVQYYSSLARLMTPAWTSKEEPDGNKVSLYGGVSLKNGFSYTSSEYGEEIRFPSFADNMGTTMETTCSKRLALMTYSISESEDGKLKYEVGGKAKRSLLYPLPLKPDSLWVLMKENGEPDLDAHGKKQYGYRLAIDMDYVRNMKAEGAPIDRRVFYIVGLGNYKTGETFDVVSRHSRPYAGPKFWCPTMIQTYDSNNYKIYRYADAVLMMAECYAGIEDVEKGLEYLNKTRVRAGVKEIKDVATTEELMAQIKDERARELAGEMHRKFDLVRWGDWYDAVKEHQEKGTMNANVRPCHRYYPIPDTECALSGYVLKNEEY